PRGEARRRPGRNPARRSEVVWRATAAAHPLPGAEGGVLPLGLRARAIAPLAVRRGPGAGARRPAAAARRVALPPAFESALPADAGASPQGRGPGRRSSALAGT